MAFRNRAQAAALLAERLAPYSDRNPIVLAIPRGAVPMGRIIADRLGGELDVVLVRKLRAPHNPELAIGSIDEHGHVYLDPEMRELWTDDYLAQERQLQLQTLAARRAAYGEYAGAADLEGRTAIVVDDGIATGSTMIAALRAVRARRPAVLVAAAAVAPQDTVHLLEREADAVVCLETPAMMYAIGMHFEDFAQVSDAEVVDVLRTGHAHAQ